jgi:hypothetical protein
VVPIHSRIEIEGRDKSVNMAARARLRPRAILLWLLVLGVIFALASAQDESGCPKLTEENFDSYVQVCELNAAKLALT